MRARLGAVTDPARVDWHVEALKLERRAVQLEDLAIGSTVALACMTVAAIIGWAKSLSARSTAGTGAVRRAPPPKGNNRTAPKAKMPGLAKPYEAKSHIHENSRSLGYFHDLQEATNIAKTASFQDAQLASMQGAPMGEMGDGIPIYAVGKVIHHAAKSAGGNQQVFGLQWALDPETGWQSHTSTSELSGAESEVGAACDDDAAPAETDPLLPAQYYRQPSGPVSDTPFVPATELKADEPGSPSARPKSPSEMRRS